MRWLPVIRSSFRVVATHGEEVQCICPWHDDHSGHLYVNARKGLYLCHVCGEKGNLASDFRPPLLETREIRDMLDAASTPVHPPRVHPEGWLKRFDAPTEYWTETRGLPKDVVERYRLGFDPLSGRVTLPVRDLHGALLGVSYRRLDGGHPKYLDPPRYAKGKHLWGAWLVGGVSTLALTEGQVDTMRCAASRVPAVATMGARITRDQVRVLQHLNISKVVALMDNDNAGRKATVQIATMLEGSGIQFAAGWYRSYWLGVKDPDGLSPQRLRKMFHSALPLLDWAERSGIRPHSPGTL